jgi:hypothetical protein
VSLQEKKFNVIPDQSAARRQHFARDTVLCCSWTNLKEKVPLKALTGRTEIGSRSSVENFIYGAVHCMNNFFFFSSLLFL